MNKLLEEQCQRNIKNLLGTETRIIQACDYITLHYTEKKENMGKIKLVSNKLVDLRELVGIYEFQCNQILLKNQIENNVSLYKDMFNILGMHIINQCNLFIKLFDDKLFYAKDYKISQQIIYDLQIFMNVIYENRTKCNWLDAKQGSYKENKYKFTIEPSIDGEVIFLKSDLFDRSYLVGDMADLERLNLLLKFIKDMSILYNEEKIDINLKCDFERIDLIEQNKKREIAKTKINIAKNWILNKI